MLLDNRKNGKVGDAIIENLISGTRVSIISALFSIYSFESLKKELNRVDSVRLLFSKLSSTDDGQCYFASLNGDEF